MTDRLAEIAGVPSAPLTAVATPVANDPVSVVYPGQLFRDPLKPPEEMNSALIYGSATTGAVTGGTIYSIDKGVQGIDKDIEDALG